MLVTKSIILTRIGVCSGFCVFCLTMGRQRVSSPRVGELAVLARQWQFCSYLYSRLRDGNGCAAQTVEPECLMPSK